MLRRAERIHSWEKSCTGDFYRCNRNGKTYLRYRRLGDMEVCWRCGEMLL